MYVFLKLTELKMFLKIRVNLPQRSVSLVQQHVDNFQIYGSYTLLRMFSLGKFSKIL